MGELCLRLAGRPLQDCYEEWVRKPARADAFLGLPEAHEPRVVELPTFNAHQSGAALAGPYRQAVFSDQSDALYCQTGRAYGHPAVGGVASARGLAAVYQWATGFGGATPGVTRETLRDFAQTQVFGYDVVLDQPLRSHAVVFQKPTAALPFGSHQAFGHDGAGGGMACADPATGLVLGYTVRRAPATAAGAEPEALDYIAAIRRCAAELREGAGIRKDHTS